MVDYQDVIKKLSDEELKGEIERITLKDESTWNLREVTELMYICLEGGYRDGFHKGYNYGIERIELEIDETRTRLMRQDVRELSMD